MFHRALRFSEILTGDLRGQRGGEKLLILTSKIILININEKLVFYNTIHLRNGVPHVKRPRSQVSHHTKMWETLTLPVYSSKDIFSIKFS